MLLDEFLMNDLFEACDFIFYFQIAEILIFNLFVVIAKINLMFIF